MTIEYKANFDNWISVLDKLPDHQNPVLVICKNGYVTRGWCVQKGYWWVYDDSKNEFHPRKASDPVMWWCELYDIPTGKR